MHHIFLIQLSGEGQLFWFQFLDITKSTSVSIVDRSNVHMVWLPILWLYAQEWLCCALLQFDNQHFEKWPPIFPQWLTSLNQQWDSDPLTAYLLQHKLSLMVLILAILTNKWWYLRWGLIFISLEAMDMVQIVLYLLDTRDCTVQNSLFSSVSHVLTHK